MVQAICQPQPSTGNDKLLTIRRMVQPGQGGLATQGLLSNRIVVYEGLPTFGSRETVVFEGLGSRDQNSLRP